jgi:hypothetical protein
MSMSFPLTLKQRLGGLAAQVPCQRVHAAITVKQILCCIDLAGDAINGPLSRGLGTFFVAWLAPETHAIGVNRFNWKRFLKITPECVLISLVSG